MLLPIPLPMSILLVDIDDDVAEAVLVVAEIAVFIKLEAIDDGIAVNEELISILLVLAMVFIPSIPLIIGHTAVRVYPL